MFVCKITYTIPNTLIETTVVKSSSWSKEDSLVKAYKEAFKSHGITNDDVISINYS